MQLRDNPYAEVKDARATPEELAIEPGRGLQSGYLSLRAKGFTEEQARRLTGVNVNSIRRWRDTDPDFKEAEAQIATTAEIEDAIRRESNKAKYLHTLIEIQSLIKVHEEGWDSEELSAKEVDYLFLARNKPIVTNQQVAEAMVNSGINLQININEKEVQSIEAKKAAAKQLLADFDASKKYRNPDEQQLIEGEVLAQD